MGELFPDVWEKPAPNQTYRQCLSNPTDRVRYPQRDVPENIGPSARRISDPDAEDEMYFKEKLQRALLKSQFEKGSPLNEKEAFVIYKRGKKLTEQNRNQR